MNETQSSTLGVVAPRFGRHGPRSKTGCSTCRIRKVKCDERKLSCLRCVQARVKCEWGLPQKPRKKSNSDVSTNNSIANKSAVVKAKSASIVASREIRTLDSETDLSQREFLQDLSPDEEFDFSFFEQSFAWFHEAEQTGPYSPLSVDHIPIANSLIIGAQDWDAFHYFPKTMVVLGLGKPWKWSMLSYIHSTVAKQEPGVMRCFIAVGAMELRAQELTTNPSIIDDWTNRGKIEELRRLAMTHYREAMKDLSNILERASQPSRTVTELDSLFAMWFLILCFEQYRDDLVENTYIHLSGIRSFISRILEQEETLELPAASKQLLHFICHLDASLALSNRRGGQLTLDLLQAPVSSGVNGDQLFELGRSCLPAIWGAEYPAEEIIDDFENYRGLSLLRVATKLKLSIWKAGIAVRSGTADDQSLKRLWAKIESVKQEYCDVLALARVIKVSSGRRVVFTVYHGALEYYSVRLLFTCIPQSSTSSSSSTSTSASSSPNTDVDFPWLESTLSDLLRIVYKALDENPALVYRYASAMCVALVKTTDPIHRDWLWGHIRRARLFMANLGVPQQLLLENNVERGVARQGQVMKDFLFIEPANT